MREKWSKWDIYIKSWFINKAFPRSSSAKSYTSNYLLQFESYFLPNFNKNVRNFINLKLKRSRWNGTICQHIYHNLYNKHFIFIKLATKLVINKNYFEIKHKLVIETHERIHLPSRRLNASVGAGVGFLASSCVISSTISALVSLVALNPLLVP